MPATTAVLLSEYLETSYRPDCEYIDGELLERNVGEWDYSRLLPGAGYLSFDGAARGSHNPRTSLSVY